MIAQIKTIKILVMDLDTTDFAIKTTSNAIIKNNEYDGCNNWKQNLCRQYTQLHHW